MFIEGLGCTPYVGKTSLISPEDRSGHPHGPDRKLQPREEKQLAEDGTDRICQSQGSDLHPSPTPQSPHPPIFPPPRSLWARLVPFAAPCEVMGKSVDLLWLPEAGPGGGGQWELGLSAPGRALVPTRDWPLGTCCGGHPHMPGREEGCPHVHTGTCRSHSCIRGTHIGTDTHVASPRACSMSTQARGPHTHTHTHTHTATSGGPQAPDARCERQAQGARRGDQGCRPLHSTATGDPVRSSWLRSIASWPGTLAAEAEGP